MTAHHGITIAELNELDRTAFLETLCPVFENCEWVAERSWEFRPFFHRDALYDCMVQRVELATLEERISLIRAHPDLGTRARISPAASRERTGAGLDRLSEEEYERLSDLNLAYREKFGFPFLFAVRGSTKYDVLQALQQRLNESPVDEHREALRQVCLIARFRLEALLD